MHEEHTIGYVIMSMYLVFYLIDPPIMLHEIRWLVMYEDIFPNTLKLPCRNHLMLHR